MICQNLITFPRGDGHIGSHLGFQVVMKTCFLSFTTTYCQFFVKWHHNGCRYHIETFYEMSNCIYAPAMCGCIASVPLLAAMSDCISLFTTPIEIDINSHLMNQCGLKVWWWRFVWKYQKISIFTQSIDLFYLHIEICAFHNALIKI